MSFQPPSPSGRRPLSASRQDTSLRQAERGGNGPRGRVNPSRLLSGGGASHSNSGENVCNSVSAFGSGPRFSPPPRHFLILTNSNLHVSSGTGRFVSPRVNSSPGRWLLRLRSLHLPRRPRRPNPRLPERKMTLFWVNLAELWWEGKKLKKVKQLANTKKLEAIRFVLLAGFWKLITTFTQTVRFFLFFLNASQTKLKV